MAEQSVTPGEGTQTSAAEQRLLKKVQKMLPDARVHSPTETGKYYGEVLFADKQYVVQQVGPQSVVAHSRGQLGDLPIDKDIPANRAMDKFGGSVVDINYDAGKGAVALGDPDRWIERKARMPATPELAQVARQYLGENVGVYTPPPSPLGLSTRYEGVTVQTVTSASDNSSHAIQRINGRTAIVHNLGDLTKQPAMEQMAATLESGKKVAFVYDKGVLASIEPIERERSRDRTEGKATSQQRDQKSEGREKTPEELKRESFFTARSTVLRAYGNDVKIYDAMKVGKDPNFEGRIVAVSKDHVIQRVAAKSFIAHERSALDAELKPGKFVQIAYAGEKAKTAEKEVRRDRQNEPSRERPQRSQGMSR
jgi:hypothetical protein